MMAAALACMTFAASMVISPQRSQFFSIDTIIITCPSESWSVRRNSSGPSSCAPPWGKPRPAGCRVGPTMPSDTGWYWCQKEDQCSPPVNITVTGKFVILKSPLFPVTEGDMVSLNCSYKRKTNEDPTSNFNVTFYKNDEFIGEYPNGKMVIDSVSKSHEGRYKCEHPSKEQSLESPLIVQAKIQSSTPPGPTSTPQTPRITIPRLLCFVLLFVLYTIILFIALSVYRKWAQARDEEKKQNSEDLSLRRINPRNRP